MYRRFVRPLSRVGGLGTPAPRALSAEPDVVIPIVQQQEHQHQHQHQHQLQNVVPENRRDLERRQRELEKSTLDEAVVEYKALVAGMMKMGKTSHLPPSTRLFCDWYVPLVEAIHQEQESFRRGEKKAYRALVGPLLILLSPEKLAVITMTSAVNALAASGNEHGALVSRLCNMVSESVQAEVNLVGLRKKFGKGILSRLTQAGALSTRRINQRARNDLEDENGWSSSLKAKLGAELLHILLGTAMDGEGKPIFGHGVVFSGGPNKKAGVLRVISENPKVKAALLEAYANPGTPRGRELPMLMEPRPWTRWDQGGYLTPGTSKVMRTAGGSRAQVDALKRAPLERVFEGLSALGKLPWKINAPVFDAALEAWEAKLPLAELPSQFDLEPPPRALAG